MKYLNPPVLGFLVYALFLGALGLYYQIFLVTPESMALEELKAESPGFLPLRLKLKGRGLDGGLSASLTQDTTNPSALANNLLTDGSAVDIQIIGERLYVGNLNADSEIFSLQDPLHPQKLSSLRGPANVWHVDAEDDLLVYSVARRGIYVFDQHNFSRRGYQLTRGESMASVHRRHYLYSAESRAGLSVYDFSNPEKLFLVSQLALDGKASDLAFIGDFLLVAAQTGGLHLVDIRDPRHPRLVKTLAAQRSYETVAVHQGIIYASDSFLQIDLLHLDADGALRRISRIPLLGSVRDMVFSPERLYFSENQNGVRSVDIRDPAAPQTLGAVVIPGDPRGLALSGNYLYVAGANAGVQIVDIRQIQPRHFLGLANTPGLASQVVANGRWLYVADGSAGLAVLDRSASPGLTQVAQLRTGSDLLRLAQSENYLYGTTRDKQLLVFDVSQPQNPRLVHEQLLPVPARALVVCGRSLIINGQGALLFRVDISIPDEPRLIETHALRDTARQLTVQGNRVYIAAGRAGLLIAQVDQNRPLQIVSAVERFWPMSEFSMALGVAVRGNFAFVSQGENGLQLLNIADIKNIRELLLLPIDGFVREIQLSDRFAVLADFENGYTFVNIQQPQRPFLAAQMPAAFRQIAGFIVDQELIYQPSRSSGVQVLPLPLALTRTAPATDSGSRVSFALEKRPQPGWYSFNVSDRRQFIHRPAVVEFSEL